MMTESSTLRLLAVAALLTGVFAIIAYIAEFLAPGPPFTPANFPASQSNLDLVAFRSYAWALLAIAAIPFFSGLGQRLRFRNAEVASAATFLTTVGVVVYAIRGILQDAGYAAANTVASPPSGMQAAYQANLFNDLANPLLPLGAAIWGLGFILFGVLARNSRVVPNWLSTVAIIGGVAGWAIFPVLNYFGDFIGYLFTEILLPFTTAIWGFTWAAILLRQSRKAKTPDQTSATL